MHFLEKNWLDIVLEIFVEYPLRVCLAAAIPLSPHFVLLPHKNNNFLWILAPIWILSSFSSFLLWLTSKFRLPNCFAEQTRYFTFNIFCKLQRTQIVRKIIFLGKGTLDWDYHKKRLLQVGCLKFKWTDEDE